MRLAQKLVLYALAVALVPLAATGFTLIRVGEGALRARIEEHQRSAAVAVSAKVSQAVEDLAQRLATVMQLVDARALSPAERLGLGRMLYRQSDDIAVVQLLDGEGAPLAPATLLEDPGAAGELSRHPAAGTADVARLVEHLPWPAGGSGTGGAVLLSPVYYPAGAAARVAVAVPCCPDADGRPGAVAGMEIALRAEVLRVEGIDTGASSSVYVVGRDGRLIAHPRAAVGEDWRGNGAVAAFLQAGNSGATVFRGTDGELRVAAFAPVGGLGWGVVVEQPEAVAFAAARSMRRQTLIWLLGTAGVVLATGLLFAARLRRVLARMVAGARAFGQGKLDERIQVAGSDEIGELAGTMNAMASDLDRSLKELEEWGRTLELRVEERTRELQSAQAQLLVQSKLAAIGQLGAGVAHEVNNPLAGVLGLVQLLLRKRSEEDKDFAKLKDIETAAKRCKEIISRLLRFSERRLVGRTQLSLNDAVIEVLDMLEQSLSQARIEVRRELAADLPVITADPSQVAQVLINLVHNARAAMAEGGVLVVATAAVESAVQVKVADTGVGIEPENLPRIFDPFFTTKRTWTDVGLGLSVAHRVVTDHGGRIEVLSKVGQGSTFTVTLPLEPPAPSEQTGKPERHPAVLV